MHIFSRFSGVLTKKKLLPLHGGDYFKVTVEVFDFSSNEILLGLINRIINQLLL